MRADPIVTTNYLSERAKSSRNKRDLPHVREMDKIDLHAAGVFFFLSFTPRLAYIPGSVNVGEQKFKKAVFFYQRS